MLSQATETDTVSVGVVPVGGFALLSYASLIEPMRAANLVTGQKLFDVQVLDPEASDVQSIDAMSHRPESSGGLPVAPTLSWEQASSLDWIFLVAGGNPETYADRGLFRRLRKAAADGVGVGGVSGGPLLLARAGLLTNRRMTVHWEHNEALGRLATGAIVQRSLYVIDRDRMTCAGGTAAIDMMHTFIASRFGAGCARKVSEWFVHTEARPGHGPQQADIITRYGIANAAVAQSVQLMESHLADTLSIEALAKLSGKSVRQLSRLFNLEVGVSPAAFYRKLRLDTAHSLLRRSDASVTDIALATGFSDAAHFSSAFKSCFDVTPSAVRAMTKGQAG
ncbi:MAG: helix-turn-helix domain-containing protein [Pseudomonadota bacterium]